MNEKQFKLVFTLLCLLAMQWSAAVGAQAAWILPTGYGESCFHTANVQRFAQEVGEATHGRLRIDVRPGGSHTPLAKIRERVENGEVAIGEFNLSAEAAVDPLFGLDALPFIVGSYEDAELLWRLSRPAIERALAGRGLVVLYAVPWPPQGLYSGHALASVRDLAGLKLRTYNPATQRLAEFLGAKPVSLPLPELQTALAQKRLDVLLTSATSGVETHTWDYMHYYQDVRAWYPKNIVVANAKVWAALSEKDRQSVLAAARQAEARGWQVSREQDARDRKQLAAHGMRVDDPSPTLAAGLQRQGEHLVREYLHTAGADALSILIEYNNRRSAAR